MKKPSVIALLLAMLMLCSLAGCGTAQQPESNFDIIPVQPGDSAEPLALSLSQEEPAADALLFVDTVEMYNCTLKLTANQDVFSLQFMAIDPDSSKFDGVLYPLPTLAKGESLYIRTYVNDAVSTRGIVYTDQKGVLHEYAITCSGKDGSIGLTQMESSADTAPIPVEILTADELTALQSFLNKMENNGFVGGLNLYDAPEKVSLEWALYDGGGVSEWVSDWSEAEKQALLAAAGWEEFYVPVTKYPAAAVRQMVQEKLGLSMEQLETPFEFVYLEAYDAYYHMHSDTNYMEVVVVDGSRSADGIYYVQYREDYDPHTIYKVTLRKVGDGYQFISNQTI